MSGKTSFTAVVVHGILFAMAVGYLLPNIDGFWSPYITPDGIMRGLPGGETRETSMAQPATEAAMQVLAEFDRQSNPTYVSGLVQITAFSKQIVSGTNTNITLQWAPSKCVKSADKALFEEYSPGECPPNGRATGLIKARIYSQPWTNTNEVTILESKSLKIPAKPKPKPKPNPRTRPNFKPRIAYD